ncbi:hypothetical protein BRADI_2g28089v3 [Brachypodium distachyon]|uniref:Uncharacterized protein n=1 Tax=Brachypodium distachyon TaxID=15368 RepID=A0A2K2DB25_BRADI|nr:hypothetical protein BRADI_2g28089v3 [Brachypodium distachyon]
MEGRRILTICLLLRCHFDRPSVLRYVATSVTVHNFVWVAVPNFVCVLITAVCHRTRTDPHPSPPASPSSRPTAAPLPSGLGLSSAVRRSLPSLPLHDYPLPVAAPLGRVAVYAVPASSTQARGQPAYNDLAFPTRVDADSRLYAATDKMTRNPKRKLPASPARG